MTSSLDYIQPMPATAAHPYVRWAVVRADGWGRPVERFCDALRAAEMLVAPVPREGLRDAVMAVYVLLVALVGLLVADWKGM